MKITLLSLFIISFSIFSFNNTRRISDCDTRFSMPGVEKVDSNLYIDQKEVSNFCYVEYLYWLSYAYGDTSINYISALPKEYLWNYEQDYLKSYADNYLRHHILREYPVVCVSQEQAVNYCKWRSDRVFEYFLIKQKIIDYHLTKGEASVFTIEKYFTGKYNGVKPDPRIKHYTNYRLPTEFEWLKAKKYFDSKYDKKKNSLFYFKSSKKQELNFINYNVKLGTIKLINDKEIKYRRQCYSSILLNLNKDLFIIEPIIEGSKINMSGNVSEWISEPNFKIGGCWKDSTSFYFEKKSQAMKPEVTIGFRCVAEYKKYK